MCCPLWGKWPGGPKGEAAGNGGAKGERWLEYANEDGLQRVGPVIRADAPSVAGATASPEGTPCAYDSIIFSKKGVDKCGLLV